MLTGLGTVLREGLNGLDTLRFLNFFLSFFLPSFLLYLSFSPSFSLSVYLFPSIYSFLPLLHMQLFVLNTIEKSNRKKKKANLMELSTSWEAERFSAAQQIPPLL
jgi:hypothetical protein